MLSRRYEVRVDPAVRSRKGYLAGDDERRATELAAALTEPDVRAVVALRGGYGTMRILPRLADALAELEAAPRLVVGSSDLTALGSAMLAGGVGWVHGPMVARLGRLDDASLERLFRIMEQPGGPQEPGLRGLSSGRATGPVVGGNLAVLAALSGTLFLPDLHGAILFVEDVGEKPYRLDRMLTQLLLSGALHGVAGALLGDFTDCSGPEGEPQAEEVVVERLACLGVPIVGGFPAAHGERCFALRMGDVAEIDGDRGTLSWVGG